MRAVAAFVTSFERRLRLFARSSGAMAAFWAPPPHIARDTQALAATCNTVDSVGAPRLLDGLAGAAFHAFIHLGIGLRLRHIYADNKDTGLAGEEEQAAVAETMVAEGLAYLSHSWLPVGGDGALFDAAFATTTAGANGGAAQSSWRGVVEQLHQERELSRLLMAEWAQVEGLATGYFQRCMHAFAPFSSNAATVSPAPAKALLRYGRIVEDLLLLPSDDGKAGGGYAAALLTMALEIFVCVRDCDYFLLHGVTAAFSLLPLLPLLSEDAARRACRRLLCGLLATYVAQGCPSLLLLPLPRPSIETAALSDSARALRWAALRRDAVGDASAADARLVAQGGDVELQNEHVYKLLWFCQDLDLNTSGHVDRSDQSMASGGGPGHWLLYAAAHKALRMELSGRSGERPVFQQSHRAST